MMPSLSPGEFMLYATPVILLISQEVRAFLTRKEIQKITDSQTVAINDAGERRAEVLQSTTLDTASKLAVHTSDKAQAIGQELTEIHTIVNGNTTALKARITELEAELLRRDAQRMLDTQTGVVIDAIHEKRNP